MQQDRTTAGRTKHDKTHTLAQEKASVNRARTNKARRNTSRISHTTTENTNASSIHRDGGDGARNTNTRNNSGVSTLPSPSRTAKQEWQTGPTNNMEILEYVQWRETKQVWQCKKQGCVKENKVRKNLIKHWAMVHKDEWKQLPRYAILRPYCSKKYSSLTHLIIQLGIRENPYTWPTCTCPIKPENLSIREIRDSARDLAKPDKQGLILNVQNKARQTMRGKQKKTHWGRCALPTSGPDKKAETSDKARSKTKKSKKHNAWTPTEKAKITQEPEREPQAQQVASLAQLFPQEHQGQKKQHRHRKNNMEAPKMRIRKIARLLKFNKIKHTGDPSKLILRPKPIGQPSSYTYCPTSTTTTPSSQI